MTVNQWLGRARSVSNEVNILERSRREEYERVTAIASQLSGSAGVTSTPNPHKFDRLAEYDLQLQKREEELLALKAEIAAAISQVDDSRYRIMLHLRYCDCRSWREIQRTMNYSKSGCFKLHGEAVAYIEGMLAGST